MNDSDMFDEEPAIDNVIYKWSAGLLGFYFVMLAVLGSITYALTLETFLKYYKVAIPIVCAVSVIVRKREMLKLITIAFSAQELYLTFLFAYSRPFMPSCTASITPPVFFLWAVNSLLLYFVIKHHDSMVDKEKSGWTNL